MGIAVPLPRTADAARQRVAALASPPPVMTPSASCKKEEWNMSKLRRWLIYVVGLALLAPVAATAMAAPKAATGPRFWVVPIGESVHGQRMHLYALGVGERRPDRVEPAQYYALSSRVAPKAGETARFLMVGQHPYVADVTVRPTGLTILETVWSRGGSVLTNTITGEGIAGGTWLFHSTRTDASWRAAAVGTPSGCSLYDQLSNVFGPPGSGVPCESASVLPFVAAGCFIITFFASNSACYPTQAFYNYHEACDYNLFFQITGIDTAQVDPSKGDTLVEFYNALAPTGYDYTAGVFGYTLHQTPVGYTPQAYVNHRIDDPYFDPYGQKWVLRPEYFDASSYVFYRDGKEAVASIFERAWTPTCVGPGI